MFLEDSTQIPSQRNRIHCIRPNDVIFRPNAQLSEPHPSGRRELSVQTFLYVENLRTVPTCIRPNFSTTRPDDFNIRQVERFLSKTQIWEDSCNRLDDVCSLLDAQASYMEIACISSTIRTSAFMVWTLKALIWKLRVAKVQPSECGPIHERISCKFKKLVAQLSVRTLLATVRTTPRKYKSNANLDSCSL
jgi:hypothetical protein